MNEYTVSNLKSSHKVRAHMSSSVNCTKYLMKKKNPIQTVRGQERPRPISFSKASITLTAKPNEDITKAKLNKNKQKPLQNTISKKHRHKNPKPNSPTQKQDYTPCPSRIYPQNTRSISHLKSTNVIHCINRI